MPRLTSTEGRRYLLQRLLLPPLAALSEDGLEVAIEEGAGVLEVLFGVGFGGGDALKRFVENDDDPPLFGVRWNTYVKRLDLWKINGLVDSTAGESAKCTALGKQEVFEKIMVELT